MIRLNTLNRQGTRMADFKLVWDETAQACDLELETINNGTQDVDLVSQDDLITATLISLLSDRVADDDWSYTLDKRGWWCDAYNERPLGSRLWQLDILPTSDDATYLTRAQGYVTEALSWLVDDRICKSVDCVASFTDTHKTKLNLDITLTKADDSQIRYAYVW